MCKRVNKLDTLFWHCHLHCINCTCVHLSETENDMEMQYVDDKALFHICAK